MTRDDGTLRAGGRGVNEPLRMALEAYHDRELSWWRQRKMERRLRRSPALQHELELLRQISVRAVAAEAAGASPDLWSDISSRLGAIDAERQSRGAAPAAANRRDPLSALRGRFGLPELISWKPVGLAVAGGSDFHGDIKPRIRLGVGTGNLAIPLEVLERLKASVRT